MASQSRARTEETVILNNSKSFLVFHAVFSCSSYSSSYSLWWTGDLDDVPRMTQDVPSLLWPLENATSSPHLHTEKRAKDNGKQSTLVLIKLWLAENKLFFPPKRFLSHLLQDITFLQLCQGTLFQTVWPTGIVGILKTLMSSLTVIIIENKTLSSQPSLKG